MSLTLANKITVCRILLVPFFIAALLCYSPANDHLRFVALGIFMFAVISDIIDGYIARTRNQKTKAGAILDPLADKILLISAFVCIYKMGVLLPVFQFPIWLVVVVISRDVILLLGAVVIYFVKGDFPIEPTVWGKANTFFQASSVVGILLQWTFTFVFWYITLALTVISAIDYIRGGIKIINDGVNKSL